MSSPDPDAVERRFQNAMALHRAGRPADALKAYDAVLATDPRHAPTLHYSALLMHENGRPDEAIVRIERSLEADPSIVDVWSNAGVLYRAAGRVTDAVRVSERAVEMQPTLAEAWLNLSTQRMAADDATGAEEAARRALSIAPLPGATFNVALALAAQGRRREALDVLNQMRPAADTPRFTADVWGLKAQMLVALGLVDTARHALDQALLTYDDPALRLERARVCETQGDLDVAVDDYERLLRPDFGTDASRELALSEYVFMKKRLVLWDDLPGWTATFRERVAWHAKRSDTSGLTPFSFLSDPSTRHEQRAAAEACARQYATIVPRAPRPLSPGRLKIGYLSADLHQHATGILAVGLFEQHDRERFEVFAYSTGPDDRSALRQRLVASFEHFVDAEDWLESRLAARIEADGIDILVDLKGYTERASTAVMAVRPAAITVSYLGYPGTMGAPFIDYVIGDRIVTPLAHADAYSETLVQLPHSYQINDDRRVIGPVPSRASLGLADDAFVFCCFNNTYKFNASVIDAWAEILTAVAHGVIWMLTRAQDQAVRQRLVALFAARGVAADRIVFADVRPNADYLALYRQADLFLDTWPYNAHTTASDALWAGCPILTIAGETFAGRVAASLLAAAGVRGGVAPDRANYVANAIAWANDRPRVAAMRAQLETSVASSPLFDTTGTTRAIESAYVEMAKQYREGRRTAILVSSDVTVTN